MNFVLESPRGDGCVLSRCDECVDQSIGCEDDLCRVPEIWASPNGVERGVGEVGTNVTLAGTKFRLHPQSKLEELLNGVR